MALDTGARGVIVPMAVGTAEEAAVAARACRHQPKGTRSLGGPVRGEVRLDRCRTRSTTPTRIAMIETAAALENLEAICATPELDAVYVGPADLSVALGARYFGDPDVAKDLEDALRRVTEAAERAGIALPASTA